MYFIWSRTLSKIKIFSLLYLSIYAELGRSSLQSTSFSQSLKTDLQRDDNLGICPYSNSYLSLPFFNHIDYGTTSDLYQEDLAQKGQPSEKLRALEEEIRKKVSFSKKLKIYYKENQLNMDKVKEKLIKSLLLIAKNIDTYCHLKSILSKDNKNFYFKFFLYEELVGQALHQGEENIFAYYSGEFYQNRKRGLKTNRIMLFPLKWDRLSLTDYEFQEILNHEIHHAFTVHQTLKKTKTFTKLWDNIDDHPASPCIFTVQNNILKNNCGDINQFLDKVNEKIVTISILLDKPIEAMSGSERKLFNTFKELTKNYQSRQYSYTITGVNSENIKDFVEKIENNLYEREAIFPGSPEEVDIKIKNYKIENDIARVFYEIYTKGDKAKAFLQDWKYKYFNSKAYKSSTIQRLEFEAHIHGLLAAYPDLYNFLLQDIKNYRISNSDKEYQQCMNIEEPAITP